MGSPEYRVGKLNGRRVITWWENNKRHRYRLGPEVTAAQVGAELITFIKTRERAAQREVSTVADLFAYYLRDREIEGKSIEKQRHSWKALRPIFGHLSPSDIDMELCRAYVRQRVAKPRSLGTAWTELSVLRAALNWAKKAKRIEVAPFIELPLQPTPKERYLPRSEAEDLLAAAVTPHVRLFILLALGTAGRASALLQLTWDRVDFDRGQIDLRTAEQNKIKRKAIVPINATLRAALSEAKAGAITQWVIEWGGQRVRSVKRAFGRAAAKCGWDDVSPHTLRHTAAVWMAEADIPMSMIAQYLGHTNSKLTEKVYARYSPSYLRKAAAALEMPAVRRVK